MRALIIGSVLSSVLACNSSCATSPAVQRQEGAAVACLPIAIPRILACHTPAPGDGTAEATCVVGELMKLWACWTGHLAPPPAASSGGSATP